MKVKQIRGIICPECGEPISYEALGNIDEVTLYECEECGAVYEDLDEAEECRGVLVERII